MKHEIKSIPPHIIFLYNYQNKLSNKTFQIQITMSNIFETYFIKINIDCLLFIFTYIQKNLNFQKCLDFFKIKTHATHLRKVVSLGKLLVTI